MAETPSPSLSQSPSPPFGPIISDGQVGGFDWMVLLAAILCAFVCALGLNTMLQCACRVFTEPRQWIASRRLNSGLKRKEMVALPTSTYTTHSSAASSPSSSPNSLMGTL